MHYISQGKKPALHKGVLHLIIGVYFLTGPRVVFSKIIIPQDLFHKVTSILLAGTTYQYLGVGRGYIQRYVSIISIRFLWIGNNNKTYILRCNSQG